jgi:oligopeptide/dipeptide ABC transporter ATP-binding protein
MTLVGGPAVGRPILEIEGLRTRVISAEGEGYAVNGVNLSLYRGEMLGLVGESGCGKTLLARSVMRLLPSGARIECGHIRLDGIELTTKSEHEMESVRGGRIAYVPQDPSASLNPVHRIDTQVGEAVTAHSTMNRQAVKSRVIDLLEDVQIPEARERARSFPHELSGGMRQRVVSAAALGGEPEVLIADEPTTSLDVTVQAAYLRMLAKIQAERGLAVIFITHDLGLVGRLCDRVAVMYAGRIVEIGPTQEVFRKPGHPYTRGLINCLPDLHRDPGVGRTTLPDIPGQPPSPFRPSVGCSFYERCSFRTDARCASEQPPLRDLGDGHWAATFYDIPAPTGHVA